MGREEDGRGVIGRKMMDGESETRDGGKGMRDEGRGMSKRGLRVGRGEKENEGKGERQK